MLLTKTPVAAATVSRHTRSFFEPTDDDLDLYRDISFKLKAQPPSSLFRYLQPEGRHLMQLGDEEPGVWAGLLRRVEQRWPGLPSRGRVASDGTLLNSALERIAYEAVKPVVPRDVALDLEIALDPLQQPRFYSDFAIRHGSRVMHIEIVGACGADRVTRNDWEAHLLAQFDRRLEVYRQKCLTPEIWYLNDLLEPAQLQKRFLALVAQLRSGVRS
ncbi:hypothetical protein BAR24_14945 [Gluconobacter oxydans]|uniref:hypothetical protein n=1 Tax=Gluconobacter thailandicus TaxID=257438 RepID=UPI00029985EB|nr:hypothetical protein [Gluconobacter thailandicus]AFW01762.1 hypothetical protein B932_2200 [Gluconobacter oxydans H24]AFW01934.1 hypothetical protein B932_2377 [Gluconobacter oxydans H24]ANQ42485.1 hypothetical protein BAR24_14095 [Gluconobacter oxydans]ANQ42634.1 hypothetical protein BAR24_14945 [Gluconobacter oxydans]